MPIIDSVEYNLQTQVIQLNNKLVIEERKLQRITDKQIPSDSLLVMRTHVKALRDQRKICNSIKAEIRSLTKMVSRCGSIKNSLKI